MLRGVVGGRQMARRAHAIPFCPQLEAVRLVAVRTTHAGRVHLALHERAVDVDLAVDLAVGVIEPRAQRFRHVVVEERLADLVVRPIVIDRRFQGFQLLNLFPDRQREVEGLKLGDVVRRVNGMPVERPDQFMKVWKSLASADQLSVEVVRGREPLIVTWAIR